VEVCLQNPWVQAGAEPAAPKSNVAIGSLDAVPGQNEEPVEASPNSDEVSRPVLGVDSEEVASVTNLEVRDQACEDDAICIAVDSGAAVRIRSQETEAKLVSGGPLVQMWAELGANTIVEESLSVKNEATSQVDENSKLAAQLPEVLAMEREEHMEACAIESVEATPGHSDNLIDASLYPDDALMWPVMPMVATFELNDQDYQGNALSADESADLASGVGREEVKTELCSGSPLALTWADLESTSIVEPSEIMPGKSELMVQFYERPSRMPQCSEVLGIKGKEHVQSALHSVGALGRIDVGGIWREMANILPGLLGNYGFGQGDYGTTSYLGTVLKVWASAVTPEAKLSSISESAGID